MMALNTASDSPGDTIIPYYYVPRVLYVTYQHTRNTDFIRAEHRICQSADNEPPFPLIITAKNPSKLRHDYLFAE